MEKGAGPVEQALYHLGAPVEVKPGWVMLGNINPGVVQSDFMRSVMNFMIYDQSEAMGGRRVFHRYLPWLAGACVDLYRNMIVENFLASDCEWLWFVDSDIEITNDTLYALLDAADPMERPVVSGLYALLLSEGTRPSAFYRAHDPRINKVSMIPYDSVDSLPPGACVPVDATGAGCLLIHRSLLESMRLVFPPMKPWFDEEIFDDVPYGEDMTFCMRVAQMGYKVHVVPSVIVAHNKTSKLILNGRTADASLTR